jgi:hypothetical protein
MITTGNLSNYQNAIYDISLSINSPLSGFELSLSETGKFYSSDLITFSGAEGYVFDQSGNFFGGYSSGVSFDLEVHHDYINSSFSYYQDGVLIANGMDITGQTNGATDKSVNCLIFNKHGDSEASLSVSGQSENSLAKHANSQINENITSAMTVTANASMLTSFTDPNGVLEGGGFNAPRSESFWAKDIDFTSVSVWNNRGAVLPSETLVDYRVRGATAITKRHIIMAKHYKLETSDVVYFVDPDGTWVSRTISAIADHASKDITVGILNEELPENISFSKVAPSNINEFFKRDYLDFITQYYRPIVAGFDFEKKLTLNLLTAANSLTLKETVYFSSPYSLPEPYDNLAEAVIGGDSGNPLFIMIGGEAILLTSYRTTLQGPSYANYISDINDLIAAADNTATVNTSLKVTEFDLNSTGFFKF